MEDGRFALAVVHEGAVRPVVDRTGAGYSEELAFLCFTTWIAFTT
jgi:hypothetical protein